MKVLEVDLKVFAICLIETVTFLNRIIWWYSFFEEWILQADIFVFLFILKRKQCHHNIMQQVAS